MANPLRPSPLSFDTGRQSPFKRQNSMSPATARATTPTQSPTKPSYTRAGSLSPEKASPFVRRPSQIGHSGERATSPFARPSSSLSIPASPSRQTSAATRSDDTPPPSPRVTPAPEVEKEVPARPLPSPSPFDGAAPSSPSITARPLPSPSPFDGPPSYPAPEALPSQANLRPTAQRTTTSSSTTSTIRQPIFNTTKPTTTAAPPQKSSHKLPTTMTSATTAYKNVPPPLLHTLRESFEVLDSTNTGTLTSASVASMLEQMGMPHNPSDIRDFFPPNAPSQFNLARYLDMLSAPISELSPPEELMAAFGAFDVDDSGQIDLSELRRALVDTAPENRGDGLSEGEIEGILGEFSGRRAFGAKGTNVAKGKGEVFRYREFMGSIIGGGGGGEVGGQDAGVGVGA
ncbi:hypothetical protein LTR37_020612 [Vermiconidia calcicola]|uniref:Uncharacterized protein n=1 Tax=Vermiconidia calcicola TaxID=1690605 RepID=A0ACC3MAZ5_9PEZI|nr:hypothetical protein LTR37_020612 [Vermiconidia calcicola]